MRRFVVAFGHTVYSFGSQPFLKRIRSGEFVVLCGPRVASRRVELRPKSEFFLCPSGR